MNKKKVFAVIALLAICTMGFAQLIHVTTSCGKEWDLGYKQGSAKELAEYIMFVDDILCGN